jgi:crotonobetainyl-CoA:carnitine CoA-transferase CaiB-like acyl-CoA transferase
MFIVGDMLLKWQTLGEVQGRVGNGTGSASPRGIYQAGDGHWLAIAASNQVIAKRLFAAMGQPELIEDPRYATNTARMARNDELQAIVSGWVASRPRAEILKILDEYEVVASSVNDSRDIVEDPHFLERSLVPLAGNDVLGRVLMPGPVLHMRSYPGPVYDGVPGIGQHTAEILRDFGLSDEEVADLATTGTISGK